MLAKVNGNTLKDSEDPAKALTGWNQVKELWRDELEKMYQQLEQKLPEAGAAIAGEKTWFGIYVSAREGLLTARNPEQPALAAREAAELMMRQTAEICYLLHHAPAAPRPDSRIGRSYAQPDWSATAECGVAFRPDTKASLILSETLCRKHTMFDSILTGLLKSAESPEQIAEVFSNSAQLYQGAYKLELTEQSAKAAPAVQSMLPYVLTVFETVMAQREQLLTSLYPDSPETVAELLSQAWREELSRLCQN